LINCSNSRPRPNARRPTRRTTTKIHCVSRRIHRRSCPRRRTKRRAATASIDRRKCYPPPWITKSAAKTPRSCAGTRNSVVAPVVRNSSRCVSFIVARWSSRASINACLPPGSLSVRSPGLPIFSGGKHTYQILGRVPLVSHRRTSNQEMDIRFTSYRVFFSSRERTLTTARALIDHAGTRERSRRSAGGNRARRRGHGAERVREARDGAHGSACARGRRFVYARPTLQARATTTKGVDEKHQFARGGGRFRRRRGGSGRPRGRDGQGVAKATFGGHRGGWVQGALARICVWRTRRAVPRLPRGEYFDFAFFRARFFRIISKLRVFSFP